MFKLRSALYITTILCMNVLQTHSQTLRVMTFNIRYNTPKDSLNSWPYRKENAASILSFYNIDICGMQEVLVGQLDDLKSLLPDYESFGVGRDDGKTGGEYSPILYNKTKFKFLDGGTFWLSSTPDQIGSKGWDAALPRVCSWIKLKQKRTGKKIFFFNTHFDHIGQDARANSSLLILQKIKEIADGKYVILTGDFNASPNEQPIQNILSANGSVKLFNTKSMSKLPHFGPNATFNGFQLGEQEGREIDYIFIKENVFEVLKHGTITQSWNGKFASDHHAVYTELKW